ncbi:MAG: response regulator [Arcobacteraceae bacterium]|nr:response regulator [Arcobacteraceae bacterium]
MRIKLKKLYDISKDLNILFVEDEVKLRDQYAKFLKNIFKTVDTASNGEEGLTKYRNFHEQKGKYYDLVISDIMMPKMNGIELSKNILKDNEEQQILIVSAYNDSNKLQSLMDLGIHFFIHKPMTLDNMTLVLSKVCSYINHQKEYYLNANNMKQTIDTLKNDFNQAVKEKKDFQDDVFGLYSLLEHYAITSLTDKEGRILDVNSDFEEISGYCSTEITGEYFDIVRDDDTCKDIRNSMKRGAIYRSETKNIKKCERKGACDEYFWTDLIVIPMIKNNEIYGFKFIEEDISEQKKAYAIFDDIFTEENNLF